MRTSFFSSVALLGIVAITAKCGGASFVLAGPDASTDDASNDSTAGGEDGRGGRDSAGTDDAAGDASRDSGGGKDSGDASVGDSSARDSGDSGHGDAALGDSGDAASGDSGPMCTAPCGLGRLCCGTACINPSNDPFNCGTCGMKCSGTNSFCNGGTCEQPPCNSMIACTVGGTCCGSVCCAVGQLCCNIEGPTTLMQCVTPTATQPTCPLGCAPACVSDRNLKRDIEPVDEQAVLTALASVPMSTWSYTSEDPRVRHLGPMAQDFYAAFGLGNSDRAYDPIDAHGVAFAAIRALYDRMQEQSARIERLELENAALGQRTCHR